MSEIRERNKLWIRDLFAGTARRHGFVYQPSQASAPGLGDYTLSLEPVEKWVPVLVENYRREVASVERHQDDSVPLARCMTATHVFAQAFGCKIHIPPDDEFPTMNPCHCPGNWVPPELGPWVSNDEVGILSPELFEEFCLPELNDLSDTFGGIAMHCCADAEHQFPGFRKIRNFYGFNRVQSKRGYLPLLDHFAGPAAPVHCLAWLDDGVIAELIAKAPAGTRFVFVMMGGDDAQAARWLAKWR